MPQQLVTAWALTPGQRKVYDVLVLRLSGLKKPFYWPNGTAGLAAFVGMNPRTVERALDRLVELRLVVPYRRQTSKGRKLPTSYLLGPGIPQGGDLGEMVAILRSGHVPGLPDVVVPPVGGTGRAPVGGTGRAPVGGTGRAPVGGTGSDGGGDGEGSGDPPTPGHGGGPQTGNHEVYIEAVRSAIREHIGAVSEPEAFKLGLRLNDGGLPASAWCQCNRCGSRFHATSHAVEYDELSCHACWREVHGDELFPSADLDPATWTDVHVVGDRLPDLPVEIGWLTNMRNTRSRLDVAWMQVVAIADATRFELDPWTDGRPPAL